MYTQQISRDLSLVRQTNPLILNITNLVVMPTTANILLALGASPLMAHAQQELDDMINLASALVLNIGTLDATWVAAMKIAQQAAIKKDLPIIFDPVGAGASQYRTQIARTIIANGVTLIRGNASEIMALVDNDIKSHGVDSSNKSHDAIHAARQLAHQQHCTVVISGQSDYIVNTDSIIRANNGSAILTKVTGMGCALTAVIAAFIASNNNTQQAAVSALSVFNIAAEIAAEKTHAPGSFATALLDALYTIGASDLSTTNINIEVQ